MLFPPTVPQVEIVPTAPVVNTIDAGITATAARRTKKKKGKKEQPKRSLLDPILTPQVKSFCRDIMVEGISLSADDDLHFQFMRNCAKAIFPVVRVNGKRVKLEYSSKKTKKKQQQKLMKFIRKVSKRNPTLEQERKSVMIGQNLKKLFARKWDK